MSIDREAVMEKTADESPEGAVRCWYCGDILSIRKAQVEHQTPRTRESNNNQLSNLVPSCRQCNARKGHRDLEEYRSHVSDLILERVRRIAYSIEMLVSRGDTVVVNLNETDIQSYVGQITFWGERSARSEAEIGGTDV
jgi:hypothetical protein